MKKKNPVKSFEHKGYHVAIEPDESPESPREWSTLGTILYSSDRYVLGDEKVDPYEASEIVNKPGVISLNVYALIHGAIALSTKPFADKWDSGQSGVIYVTTKDALEAFGKKRMTPALRKRVNEVLKAEIEVFGQYLNGEVYGYIITDEQGKEVDSLWGLYGLDYAVEAAEEQIDSYGR